MDQTVLLVLIKLVFAHCITDFILQPTSWVRDRIKRKYLSPYLYVHSLLTGLVVYLVLADWAAFQVPLIIMGTHFVIDLWKAYQKPGFTYFFIDQLLHLMIIVTVWWVWYVEAGMSKFMTDQLLQPPFWVVLTGYVIATGPMSIGISIATERWRNEITVSERDSLADAGRWIGIFERVLILTFVLTSQFAAIGLLIAAKSILRFSDKDQHPRKQTEYILIGTLLSFALSVILGLLMLYMLDGKGFAK